METLALQVYRTALSTKKAEPRSRKEKAETFYREKKRKAVMLSKQLLIVSGGDA